MYIKKKIKAYFWVKIDSKSSYFSRSRRIKVPTTRVWERKEKEIIW